MSVDLNALTMQHPVLFVSRVGHSIWTPLVEKCCAALVQCGVPVVQVAQCPPGTDGVRMLRVRPDGVSRYLIPSQAKSKWRVWRYVASLWEFESELAALISRVQPRALLFENCDLACIMLRIAGRFPRLPLIYWATELSCCLRQKPHRTCERQIASTITGLVMNDPDRIRIWMRRNCYHGPSLMIPNTIDCAGLPPSGSKQPLREMFAAKSSPVKVIVLYQGMASPEKSVLELVEALALLPEYVGLAIIGKGSSSAPYARRVDRAIDRLNLASRIVTVDWLPFAELMPFTFSADIGAVLVKPIDDNHRYSASSKLYQYMRCGLPILGADVPAVRRIVEEDDIGVVVDSRLPGSIADGLRKLGDASVRRRLSANALRLFNERRCFDVVWPSVRSTLLQWLRSA